MPQFRPQTRRGAVQVACVGMARVGREILTPKFAEQRSKRWRGRHHPQRRVVYEEDVLRSQWRLTAPKAVALLARPLFAIIAAGDAIYGRAEHGALPGRWQKVDEELGDTLDWHERRLCGTPSLP